jgi:NADH-quinone oxidoreductase subunit A
VSLAFASLLLLLPVILRSVRVVPRKPNPVKSLPFECGMETIGKSWVQFNFRYYFYALVLIALDVMVVFVYPWAVGVRQLGVFGLVAALVFILLISLGYVYAWRKRVLEWK